ncbi:hypothetical protein BA062_22550 [Prauserella flavalba]|uniref:Uncharacterized protein n=1 Tax=Prauserella flavalba TaxID=1477506 RepID=A0A318LH20_9PSEU|nr:hypothetical protein [Prauserella flavalba]PXY28642.1 hypothetical protein BA062_22550 [Prauserella flavalba]
MISCSSSGAATRGSVSSVPSRLARLISASRDANHSAGLPSPTFIPGRNSSGWRSGPPRCLLSTASTAVRSKRTTSSLLVSDRRMRNGAVGVVTAASPGSV